MPLGDAQAHPRRPVEGGGVGRLVQLAPRGVAPRLEDGPQASARETPQKCLHRLGRTAVGWWAKSSMTATPSTSARSSWRRRTPAKLAKPAWATGKDTPSAETTAQAPTAFSTLWRPGTRSSTWPRRFPRWTRVKCVPAGPCWTSSAQTSAGVPGPRAYRTRRQRAWPATSRALGQWALTAKKPSSGSSWTKFAKADW